MQTKTPWNRENKASSPVISSTTTSTSAATSTSLTWVNVYTPQHLAGASACNGEGHLMIHSSHRLSTTYVNKCDKEKLVRVQKKGNCFMSDWQITKPAGVNKSIKKSSSSSASTTVKRTISTTTMHLEATPSTFHRPMHEHLHHASTEQRIAAVSHRKVVEIKSLIHNSNKTISTQECVEIMQAALQMNSKSALVL